MGTIVKGILKAKKVAQDCYYDELEKGYTLNELMYSLTGSAYGYWYVGTAHDSIKEYYLKGGQ